MIEILSLAGISGLVYGISLAVMAYNEYSFQKELRKGDDKNIALRIGRHQGLMANVLMSTLLVAFPALALYRWTYFFLSTTMFMLPVIAGLQNGGYANIKHKQSRQSSEIVMPVINFVDRMVQKIPASALRISKRISPVIQNYFDSLLYIAQIACFVAVAVFVNPVIGIAGVGYIGVSEAKARGFLPTKISTVLDHLNYWVGLCCGIFTQNAVLVVRSLFRFAHIFAMNIILPRVMHHILDKDSEFLKVINVNEQQPAPALITRNTTVPQFKKLLEKMPNLDMSQIVSEVGMEPWIASELGTMHLRMTPTIDLYCTRYLKPRLDDLAALEKEYYETFALLAQNPSLANRIKGHLKGIKFGLQNLYLLAKVAFYIQYSSYNGALNFFDQSEANSKSGLAVTISHMAQVPSGIPDIEPIELNEFRALVNAGNLQNSINIFKDTCFKEPKFQMVNNTLQEELFALKDAEAGKVEIAAVHRKMLQAWRIKLEINETATDDEIVIAYTKYRLEDVYYKISTGHGMQYDKTATSIVKFQTMGRHVLHHCAKLLKELAKNPNKQKEAEVHDILARLANEAGAFCAHGIIDVILEIYFYIVLNEVVIDDGFISQYTPQEQLALTLQKQRAELFDIGYNMASNSSIIRMFLPHAVWDNKHTRSFFESLAEILHLPKQLNANSDLSNINNIDFLTRLQWHFLFYFAMRAMMLVPHGYSPEQIVENMMIAAKSEQKVGVFNPINCCVAWAQGFGSDEDVKVGKETIRRVVNELMQDWYSERDESTLRKLFTLMLIDLGVFKITNTHLKSAVNDILSEDNVAVLPDTFQPKVTMPDPDTTCRTMIFSQQPDSRQNNRSEIHLTTNNKTDKVSKLTM